MFIRNCDIHLSQLEQMHIDAFKVIDTELKTATGKAYKAETFGKTLTSKENWDYAFSLMIFQLLLTIIKARVDDDTNNGIRKSADDYWNYYMIKCWRKKFNCKGFNINTLLEVYGLDYTTLSISSGIDFDLINSGSNPIIVQ